MSISNPNKLVEEFKKSGEFDRIRRELLSQFQNSGLVAFKSSIEDVARQRLSNDHNLMYMPQEFIHRELMQELDRFPIVERSTSELPMLNDPALSRRIIGPLEKLLQDQGISVKTKQTEQEKPQNLLPGPCPIPQPASGEESKRPRSITSDDSRKECKSSDESGAALDASASYIKPAPSTPVSSEKRKGEGEDSNKMEVDED